MATDNQSESFYQELDKARHSPGCGCMVMFVLGGAILLIGVWFLVSTYYF